MKDLYKTLGVAEDADDAAIKKTYRKLAKEFHPDVTGGDKKKTERFKEINEAYGVLGDKQKRTEYDRLKHAPVRPDGMPEGFDADAFARTFGGGFGGEGRAVGLSIPEISLISATSSPASSANRRAGAAGARRGRSVLADAAPVRAAVRTCWGRWT